MANDPLKIKVQKLRESLSKLETQKTVAISENNKVKTLCCERLIKRFEADLQLLQRSKQL